MSKKQEDAAAEELEAKRLADQKKSDQPLAGKGMKAEEIRPMFFNDQRRVVAATKGNCDARMLEHLEKQEKITVMFEKREGEWPQYDVTVNGIRYCVPRGRPVLVPQQIAEMLYERMTAEGSLVELSRAQMRLWEKGVGTP